ncbi:uncharacterized protein A4U43_C07F21140 [Asparagus officinalis]|uniref:Fe2OG dioxygenase domain-containing protein n=1 Tax=Asparagus officinalis TaxID=4686 RepID=A0A5P1EDN9_ASPOF|nr:gibberellin 20-oxidase-like protein [Asparagus officinalis]XP_020273963.1 gibberellin 20-oxidase-like protein [Asparagus officinalis]XP_020273965.1 gibberellin 20-oxidase-like protein [Asparagus officinalis]XP_020273966.1 gibberellin 20-oxidase-like protein [Asparagus officinalis]ONK64006.1 uncharacterized protein A4U43_C07F21140 [Asparagus officinalis]
MSKSTKIPLELPILDMSKPMTSSSLYSLSQACKDWGFFHITEHGISKDLYTKLCTLSNQAFSLSPDIKLKLGPSSSINSYTPHFIASPFFESLRISGPNFSSSAKITTAVLFENPNIEFCEILAEYGHKMMELSRRIMTILLNCLGDGFETKYLRSEFSKCHGYLRINSYTPPRDIELEEKEGLGMHTDMSCITIVYQDDVGGLQVKSKEGKWMDIIPVGGRLVVNIGDLLQAWSNGRLRSSQHRVVLKKPVHRLSLAFFWCFEDEKIVSAPQELLEEGEERIYKPFLCCDYIKFRENSERGRFDKVGYTVDGFAANM